MADDRSRSNIIKKALTQIRKNLPQSKPIMLAADLREAEALGAALTFANRAAQFDRLKRMPDPGPGPVVKFSAHPGGGTRLIIMNLFQGAGKSADEAAHNMIQQLDGFRAATGMGPNEPDEAAFFAERADGSSFTIALADARLTKMRRDLLSTIAIHHGATLKFEKGQEFEITWGPPKPNPLEDIFLLPEAEELPSLMPPPPMLAKGLVKLPDHLRSQTNKPLGRKKRGDPKKPHRERGAGTSFVVGGDSGKRDEVGVHTVVEPAEHKAARLERESALMNARANAEAEAGWFEDEMATLNATDRAEQNRLRKSQQPHSADISVLTDIMRNLRAVAPAETHAHRTLMADAVEGFAAGLDVRTEGTLKSAYKPNHPPEILVKQCKMHRHLESMLLNGNLLRVVTQSVPLQARGEAVFTASDKIKRADNEKYLHENLDARRFIEEQCAQFPGLIFPILAATRSLDAYRNEAPKFDSKKIKETNFSLATCQHLMEEIEKGGPRR